MTSILGISGFYHDSAAALIIDGNVTAAAQEERFSRNKHDSSFPKNAIKYVLNESQLNIDKIDHIVFYDKPLLKFDRLIKTYIANAPQGFRSFKTSMPLWLREKLFQKILLEKELKKLSKESKSKKILFTEHHLSHAASAFFPSPFENAIILTLDGVGEWATTTVSIGNKNKINIVKEILFPHSVGLLYSAFTYFLGFKVNSGEYKVMGLAPYGEPKYTKIILDNIIDLKDDGSFRLDQSYFNYSTGLTMTNNKFSELFGHPVRKPETEMLTQFHMDMASSIQFLIEEIVLRMTKNLSNEFKMQNLCMAGGVALNCVANAKILNAGCFKNLWVQPAAGDAGGALGAALALWHNELDNPRKINQSDSMKGSFLGPQYSQVDIENSLKECKAEFEILNDKDIIKKTANALANEKTIGWFQGRMEFGPRALGARSIIADPRLAKMQKNLNLKVKYRESFRPFAPSVLREDLQDWFELNYDSPYMLLVAQVKKSRCKEMTLEEQKLFGIQKLNVKRSEIPAVTHVDYSARIQTVNKETNPKYYDLINEFKKITGCPILVNTSFNVRGEPIVCTPKEAFKCFMGTELDILVIGNCFLYKEKQNSKLSEDYKIKYNLD